MKLLETKNISQLAFALTQHVEILWQHFKEGLGWRMKAIKFVSTGDFSTSENDTTMKARKYDLQGTKRSPAGQRGSQGLNLIDKKGLEAFTKAESVVDLGVGRNMVLAVGIG